MKFSCWWLAFLMWQILGAVKASNPLTCQIRRDAWGIPHVFAASEAEAAMGLAYAHAQDDFLTLQKTLLPTRALAGSVQGKEGALLDFFTLFFGLRDTVEAKFPTAIPPEFLDVLRGYTAGLNAFAKDHPNEILHPALFPVQPVDVLTGYSLAFHLFSGAAGALGRAAMDQWPPLPSGSNAFALGKNVTTDGSVMLLANPHNAYEGLFSWYEAAIHVAGKPMRYGATFPGGVSLFMGCSAHLAWTHTFNFHDFSDAFLIPEAFFQRYSQQMQIKKIAVKVKVKGMVFTLSKKVAKTPLGPAILGKKHGYVIRSAAEGEIRGAEQWWRMGMANNWQEFEQALRLDALPLLNLIYADAEGGLAYYSLGHFPQRTRPNTQDPQTLTDGQPVWQGWVPFDQRPHFYYPEGGFLFNVNNTPLNHRWPESPLPASTFQHISGFQTIETNRSARLAELLPEKTAWSREDLLALKFDQTYPQSGPIRSRANQLMQFVPPHEAMNQRTFKLLQDWNGKTDTSNIGAAHFLLFMHFLADEMKCSLDEMFVYDFLPPLQIQHKTLRKVTRYLLRHFGTVDVPLGTMQRMQRGTFDAPMSGLKETLAEVESAPEKNGIWRANGGDSFMMLVQFGADGKLKAWAMQPFGASKRPNHPHAADQLPLFYQKKWRDIQVQPPFHFVSDTVIQVNN